MKKLSLVGLGPPGARQGGVERYGAWLEAQLRHQRRLAEPGDSRCIRFALKARLGGEVVRTGDGVSAAWVEATGRSHWRWWRHIARERRALQAARRVIAISPMVADDLSRCYGIHDATVLLNPVFTRPSAPEPSVRGAWIFVGHGFYRKGLDRFLEALEHCPHRQGIVVGHDRRFARWCRRGADRLGGRVRFLGAVDAGPLVAGASALVHPARYEPYGNVVAEAVAAHVPVVCSAKTGASCLLPPAHIWHAAEGAKGLAARVEAAIATPMPPALDPPTATAHLDALFRALR